MTTGWVENVITQIHYNQLLSRFIIQWK